MSLSKKLDENISNYELVVAHIMETNKSETYRYKDFYLILMGGYKNNCMFKKGLTFF